MLRTQLTMSALTRGQIFNGAPYLEQSIPPQAVDIAKAKEVAATVKESAESFGLTYIILFVLLIFLNYGMELFWGSIRNLQVIFTLTLIKF